MASLGPRQSIEVFHLLLVSHIGRKLDQKKWSLKGGCNLRFFFRSPRYSDDVDLDVQGIPVSVLREKINSIISGKPFQAILGVRGILVEHLTEHKQTETTQRWKFGLMVPGLDLPVPTKLEFSRRGLEPGSVFEPLSPEIIRQYELPPLMANHYPAPTVWRQKIGAILSRTAPQARDVFDLHVLLETGLIFGAGLAQGGPEAVKVRDHILAVDFGQFKSQVISYLEPDIQSQYDSQRTWDMMRWRIIESLEAAPE